MASSAKTNPSKGAHDIGNVVSDLTSSSRAGPSANSSSTDSIKTALYNHCAAQPPETIFTQKELLASNLIPSNSLQILQQITLALSKSGQLKTMQRAGQVCWRCIPPSVVAVHRSLDPDAALVYSYIESAGREGMLASSLNRRTNFHKATMDKCIKVLEHRRLIKTVPNYRHPKRKTFMLWGLQPAEDVTGGPFYGSGELDEEFVRTLVWWIERYVVGRSWWFPPEKERVGKKRKHDGQHKEEGSLISKEEAVELRAKGLEESPPPPTKDQARQRSRHMLPFPPGYKRYPTITEITKAVNASGLAKVIMKISDTQLLVDILCWDGKLERIKRRDATGDVREMYRAVKNPVSEKGVAELNKGGKFEVEGDGPAGYGLTEAPCGRCPVFEFCEEGGLVSATTCPYFKEWLAF
ncbi:MAG: hypothetical protein Q9163_000538 [Psora crenata]